MKKLNKNLYQGIFPALVTPLTSQKKINPPALKKVIELNIGFGVKGFYVCGTTAEADFLSFAQKKKIFSLVSAIVKKRVTLIAQIGYGSLEEAIQLGKLAKELGYDAVSAITPKEIPKEKQPEYFRKLLEEIELPLVIYTYPAKVGVSFEFEDLKKLLKDKRIMGVKYTAMNTFYMERIKQIDNGRLVLFNGHDECLLSGLAAGADGAIGSTYNFHRQGQIIFRLFQKGKIKEAQKHQTLLNDLIETMIDICGANIIPGVKFSLKYLYGIDCGPLLNPRAKRLTASEKKRLQKVLLNRSRSGKEFSLC